MRLGAKRGGEGGEAKPRLSLHIVTSILVIVYFLNIVNTKMSNNTQIL